MLISNFGSGLQKALSYLPSTCGTSLLKNHMLRGIFEEMEHINFVSVIDYRTCLLCNSAFDYSNNCFIYCFKSEWKLVYEFNEKG